MKAEPQQEEELETRGGKKEEKREKRADMKDEKEEEERRIRLPPSHTESDNIHVHPLHMM